MSLDTEALAPVEAEAPAPEKTVKAGKKPKAKAGKKPKDDKKPKAKAGKKPKDDKKPKAKADKKPKAKADKKSKDDKKPKGDHAHDSLEALIEEAKKAQKNAYAPYSKFRVGAALVTKSGRVFHGCNVENASYPAGICAERTALVSMIAAGEKNPVAIAIVTPGKRGGSPCGVCRQTLTELAKNDLRIALVGSDGKGPSARRDTTLGAIFPDAFDFEPEHDPRR